MTITEILTAAFVDRGDSPSEWPSDEAQAFKDAADPSAGRAAAAKLRVAKAVSALTDAGYGNVATAKADALDEFAVHLAAARDPRLDKNTMEEVQLEARSLAEEQRVKASNLVSA